ncbi:uncharacterized protein LOC118837731 [Trichosurus vulpecula]|uniref:uncharacterized protein LOC118837731 n=1 Tax=Trichosurus vulpecula TaxID=9337 RepID=UPI00186B1AD7|nr:uncharacterized protein LOC118837731 [Trichosurus vulpecula]
MGKNQRHFPKAVRPQVPTNGHCHQAKSVLLPGLPHQIAPLSKEERVRSRAEQMAHLQHHTRTKLSSLPDHRPTPLPLTLCPKHRVTAAKVPSSSMGTVTAPLPKLEHPRRTAKPSMPCKHNSRVTILPSLCPEYRAKVTPDHWVTCTPSLSSQSRVMVESSSCPQILARATATPSAGHGPWAKTTSDLLSHAVHWGDSTPLPFLYSDHISGSSSHPDHQTIPSPHAGSRAKVPTSLPHQVRNKLGHAQWTEELPRFDYWAIPLLISDPQAESPGDPKHQEETVPGCSGQTAFPPGLNHPNTIPSSLDYQTESSLGPVHLTTLQPGQDNWTYAPLDPDNQYTTPQDPDCWIEARDTTRKVIPNPEVTPDTAPNIIPPTGSDRSTIPSAGLRHQNATDHYHQAEGAVLGSSVQGTSPLALGLGEIIPLGPDHQAIPHPFEATANFNAPVTLTSGVCHRESRTLGSNRQAKYPEEQENWAITQMGCDPRAEEAVLGLNGQGTMSLGSDHKLTRYPGTDCQAEAAADLYARVIFLGPDGQTKNPEEEENQQTPQTGRKPQAEEDVPDPNIQTTSLPVPGLEEAMPLGSDSHASVHHRPDLQVQSAGSPNITHSIPIHGLDHGTKSPEYPGSWAVSVKTHIPKVKFPTSYDIPTEVKMNCDDQVETQPGLRDQLRNKDTQCLSGIEPLTIERWIVPIRIINAIISSIPQEKIKIDIYKQIILQQKSQCTNNWPNELISSSYRVCLACASWIPNGCPHVQEMKHLFQAQLLAIPTPLHGSEEVGLKLILRMPQQTCACPVLSDPCHHYGTLRPSHHSILLSSCSDSVFPKSSIHQKLPAKVPRFGYMLGNDQQPHRQKISGRQQTSKGELQMKDNDNRKEKSKRHGKFSKFLLGRFQKRRKK